MKSSGIRENTRNPPWQIEHWSYCLRIGYGGGRLSKILARPVILNFSITSTEFWDGTHTTVLGMSNPYSGNYVGGETSFLTLEGSLRNWRIKIVRSMNTQEQRFILCHSYIWTSLGNGSFFPLTLSCSPRNRFIDSCLLFNSLRK